MPSECSLHRSFTKTGRWWLPNSPSAVVHGVLHFDPNGTCELELAGSLWGIGSGDPSLATAPLVYGKTSDGEDCTLSDTFEVSRRSSLFDVSRSRIVFNQLLIGDGLCVPAVTGFSSCEVDIGGMGEWMARDPFNGIVDAVAAAGTTQRCITYTRPEPISIDVPCLDSVMQILPHMTGHYAYRERRLEYREVLTIAPREPKTCRWFLDVVFAFRALLDLFLSRIAPIGSIALISAGDDHMRTRDRQSNARHEVCFRPVGPVYDPKQHLDSVPFPYPVLAADLSTIVNEWFRLGGATDTLANLQFGVAAREGLTPEFRFLAMMQGLESHHRGMCAGTYMLSEEYDAIRIAMERAIPSGAPPALRDSLRSRLKYGNEYSLRKRMEELVADMPEALRAIAFGDEAMSVSRIVDTRNYITHRDESLRTRSMTPAELTRAVDRLDVLASFHLLRRAGLSMELLEGTMAQDPAFMRKLR